MSLPTLLRADGSPKYLGLRWEKTGALIVISIPSQGFASGVRVHRKGFDASYAAACAMVLKRLARRDALAKETLHLAKRDYIKRYNVQLETHSIERVVKRR
jgi:hypothetical protein